MKLILSGSRNAKLAKGGGGFRPWGMSMTPATSGVGTVCPWATTECRAMCIASAGRGSISTVRSARQARRDLWDRDPAWFTCRIQSELEMIARLPGKHAVRLNVLSDIDWWGRGIRPPHSIRLYDYTKDVERALSATIEWWEYDLTFSRSESNEMDCFRVLDAGGRVACVFAERLPEVWKGWPVMDGDRSDFRFLDSPGVVGLLAKGRAKRARADRDGFVIFSHLS